MIRQRRCAMAGLVLAAVMAVSVFVAEPAFATGPLLTRNRAPLRPGAPIVQSGSADAPVPQRRRAPINPDPFSEHNFGPSYPFGYNYTGPSYPFGRGYRGPLLSAGSAVLGSPALRGAASPAGPTLGAGILGPAMGAAVLHVRCLGPRLLCPERRLDPGTLRDADRGVGRILRAGLGRRLLGTDAAMGEAVYLKQIELGPMQNFVYLIGDPESRECVVVDPAWEIDGSSTWRPADDMRLTRRAGHPHPPGSRGRHLFGSRHPRASRSCSPASPSRSTCTRRSASSSMASDPIW